MILVTGGGGQLSGEILKISKKSNLRFIFKKKKGLDINNYEEILNFILKKKIKVLINTAAVTNVDLCEINKNYCMRTNYESVKNIVKICNKLNILLVHISTDYVYFGQTNKSYSEKSKENPKNIYGQSKLKADNYIKKYSKKFYILRSGWIFSKNKNNFLNFVDRLINQDEKINLIINQFGNPTSARSLAEIIITIIEKYNKKELVKFGVYNFCNYPKTTWYKFGSFYIKKILKIKKININRIHSSKLNLKAKRPINSSLDSSKILKVLKIKGYRWKKELKKIN